MSQIPTQIKLTNNTNSILQIENYIKGMQNSQRVFAQMQEESNTVHSAKAMLTLDNPTKNSTSFYILQKPPKLTESTTNGDLKKKKTEISEPLVMHKYVAVLDLKAMLTLDNPTKNSTSFFIRQKPPKLTESTTNGDLKKKKTEISEPLVMHKYVAVLDLDQTLISTCKTTQPNIIDLQINGANGKYYISIRPHAVEFIKALSKHFHLLIYTSSHYKYAEKVVELLDKEHKYIRPECLIAFTPNNDSSTIAQNDMHYKLKKLKHCAKYFKHVPIENYVIFDDNMLAWDPVDLPKLVLSMKYYSSISDINFDDITHIVHNNKILKITQTKLGINSPSFPYLETDDSYNKQLINIQKFLIQAIKEHEGSPNETLESIVTKKKMLFREKTFDLSYIFKGFDDIYNNELLDMLKALIEIMGGNLKKEGDDAKQTYIVFMSKAVGISIAEYKQKGTCITYEYITDTYFHLCPLNEDSYMMDSYEELL